MATKPTPKKNGRPSKKDTIRLEKMQKLLIAGLTQDQLAIAFDVSVSTIKNYMQSDKKFLSAVKGNSELADSLVEASLWKRAMGYKYDEVHCEKVNVGMNANPETSIDEIEDIKAFRKKVITKEVVADTTAQIFWLKNRQPKRWRDVKHNELSGKDGEPIEVKDVSTLPTDEIIKQLHTRLTNG